MWYTTLVSCSCVCNCSDGEPYAFYPNIALVFCLLLNKVVTGTLLWFFCRLRNKVVTGTLLWFFCRLRNKVTLIGDLAEPCTCNPLQQGLIPVLRIFKSIAAANFSVLRCGSCAIVRREPCQVGNQAALSGVRQCAAGAPVLSREFERRMLWRFDFRVCDLIL